MDYYTASLQHLLAELERIDLLIQVQYSQARQEQSSDFGLQGMYISDKEIESLLTKPLGIPYWATTPNVLSLDSVQQALHKLTTQIDASKQASLQNNIPLNLEILRRQFGLSPFDIDVVMICLAPEIDLRYARIYGYLQNDASQKKPSVNLIFDLLSPTFERKLEARSRFSNTAPLLKTKILTLSGNTSEGDASLLSQSVKLDDRIVNFLLGSDEIDATLQPITKLVSHNIPVRDLVLPTGIKARLFALIRKDEIAQANGIFYFQGGYGVGKETTAGACCLMLGKNMLKVDGRQLLLRRDIAFADILTLILREALLQDAALYWQGFDALLEQEQRFNLAVFLEMLATHRGLIFLAGNAMWEPMDALHNKFFVRVELPELLYDEREKLWLETLADYKFNVDRADIQSMAAKFRFSAGQIRDAAITAHNLALWRNLDAGEVTISDLYAASRMQSNQNLGLLAQKITPHYQWNDIVLPYDQFEQLREIFNMMKYRAQVYGSWGFDRKLALGKGLNILFAGPSGTGKTMAAEIIAGQLGLELYKIDLSGVVSKYIGETEKNLGQIFAEAKTSNSILFFDEADALFGKRSEVRDARDRYANVEISYLLQKMEEYDGVVILTTNLRKNMDEAFVRRMHFAIDFPFPAQNDRLRIWEQIFPDDTPRDELDLAFMASQFELTGGNIRNIALSAAFLAADDGGIVTMAHLIRATRREYQKVGKVMTDDEFGVYGRYARRH